MRTTKAQAEMPRRLMKYWFCTLSDIAIFCLPCCFASAIGHISAYICGIRLGSWRQWLRDATALPPYRQRSA